MSGRGFAVLAALGVLGSAAGAYGSEAAPEPPREALAEAEAHANRAQALFEARRFDAAIAALEAAMQVDPRPRYLFNIALCHEWKGDYIEATRAMDDFLRRSPSSADQSRARDALQRFTERSQVARLDWRIADAGASVTIDGELVGVTPLRGLMEAPIGPHRLAVTLPGHEPWERTMTLAGGQLLRLDVALTRIPRGQATLIVDAAAEASLDGRSLGAGPMRQVLHLAPGAHSLRVVGPEGRRPVRVDFEVADGARETLRISERDLAPIEAPVAPWIVAGAGLALGVGGVVTCVQASDLRAEFAADRDADGYYLTKTDAQRAAAQRRLQRLDGATAALWATGGAAIAAGLVWWWIASDEADDDVILVAPMAGPGTAGAAAQGRF